MRKKQILLIAIAVITGATFFLVHGIAKKVRSKPHNFPTTLHALTLDSAAIEISLISADTTLVIVFNSECDICRIELESLLVNYSSFERFNIILLSRQNIDELQYIEANYNLNNYANFEILKIDEIKTEEPFLSASNPSLFVFQHNGKLMLQKKGYYSLEQLINQLQK